MEETNLASVLQHWEKEGWERTWCLLAVDKYKLWEKRSGNGESSQSSPLLALITAPGTDFGEGKSIITELESGAMGKKKKAKQSKQTPGQDYLAKNKVLYVALTSYEVMFQVTHVANITHMFR